jgi:hypothetical protein
LFHPLYEFGWPDSKYAAPGSLGNDDARDFSAGNHLVDLAATEIKDFTNFIRA